MNGFGFIEYKDAMDARDVVPGTYPQLCHLIVQMSQQKLYPILLVLHSY